jgi:dihydroflavonol-4-reductase
MRIAITGGTGFIGSRLALRCLADGHAVRVFGQENTPAEAENRRLVEAHGAEIVVGSVTDRSALGALCEGVDVVVHLAATQHEMNVPDQRFWDVNVEGTRNALEAAVESGVKRFVHGSTIGVYAANRGTIDESSPCEPDNIYGRTKLAGEELVLGYGARLPVVVVRIPEVYGPGDRRLVKLFRAVDRGVFFMIGSGRNVHHVIFVDDLVDGFLRAAEEPGAVGEVMLLAGKEPVTTNEMVAGIARALDRRPPRLRVPLFPFLVLAVLMEKALRPLGIRPPLHRRRLDFFRKTFTLSGAKAKRAMGFSPAVGFDEGARRTAAWYRQAGLLPAGPDGADPAATPVEPSARPAVPAGYPGRVEDEA